MCLVSLSERNTCPSRLFKMYAPSSIQLIGAAKNHNEERNYEREVHDRMTVWHIALFDIVVLQQMYCCNVHERCMHLVVKFSASTARISLHAALTPEIGTRYIHLYLAQMYVFGEKLQGALAC